MLTAAAVGAATGWRNAVRAAAALLVEVGATTPEYGERCIGSAEELGPYFVLSPGVALAHARDCRCSDWMSRLSSATR